MFYLQLHLPEFCVILSGQTYVLDGDIMLIQENLSVQEKLKILTDAAKYDVACTSSGVRRKGKAGSIGNNLPQLFSGRQMYFTSQDSVYQPVYLRLQILREPLFQ